MLKPGIKGWAKWWRFKYRFGGNEKGLSFGTYPDVSLEQARQRRDDARKLIADGVDPGENRKAVKETKSALASNSLEVIALEWGAKNVNGWGDKYNRSKRMLEKGIFPKLGGKSITDIRPREILACLQLIEAKGNIETAHRTLQVTGQVFRYAVATGRAERDITQDLKGALPSAKGGHFAAITEPKQAADLLRAIDGYQGLLPYVP